ncbi:MAG TPA: hypothetical protein VGB99_13665 [Acidobacteriota bacterium]
MIRSRPVLGCLLLATCLATSARGAEQAHSTLTADQVAAAIERGLRDPGAEPGLVLQDRGQAWAKRIMPNSAGTGRGFSIVVYTPTTWVAKIAAQAELEGERLTPEAIEPEMLEPLLRVVAYPDLPTSPMADGVFGTASVEAVLLRDESKRVAIEAIDSEPFDRTDPSGLRTYQGLMAAFRLEEVERIRSASRDREFYVTVTGTTGETKNFKIKKEFHPALP